MTDVPDWWRGQVPPGRPPDGLSPRELVTGSVSAVGSSGLILSTPLRRLHFYRATVVGVDLWLTDVHLAVEWSEFHDCRFRQRVRPVLDPDGCAAQGSFGNSPALYRGCTFERVRFKTLGGFSLGNARFEACTFVDCRWEGHFADATDLVDNRFVGRMNGCAWVGRSRSDNRYRHGRRNVIHGNDFTQTRFTDNVGWRQDFPLEAQRWPAGFAPLVDD
ncbi:hypothetical protein ACQE98_11590 [Ornithinimicrobium sp. W1679]|uniref:hypothetical protein n=1 Tax=Ornithinimicrobium sp. W1679 TaxID=3418770 RepID=UPI003CE69ACB